MKTDNHTSVEALNDGITTVRPDTAERWSTKKGLQLESMEWMVARIVHDIRNPLGSIELIASLLRKELANDTDKQRLINHILYGIKNIDSILANLLHYTRSPVPKLSRVILRDIVHECLDMLSYQIEKHGVSTRIDIHGEIKILCDRTLLVQVFLNLFLNSLQAMPDGGELSIFAVHKGKQVEIFISDTGTGISQENIKRIFNPFFTTKDKGTGLGLTIVYNIVRVHGGSIRVYSHQDKGSTFVIAIPAEGGKEA